MNSLCAIGVKTVAQLIAAAKRGIEDLAMAGELTSGEIIDSLDALAENVARNGRVDWVAYARKRSFVVLPETKRRSWAHVAFVQELPAVAEAAVLRSRYGSSGLLILRDRILKTQDRLTLKRSGQRLRVTGERVRVIEMRILKMFRRAFLSDEYRDCRFRLRPEFVKPLRQMAMAIEKMHILSPLDWDLELTQRWGITRNELGSTENLLFEILSLQKIELCETNAWVIAQTDINSASLRLVSSQIRHLLTCDYPLGLSLSNLDKLVNRRFGIATPSRRELCAILRSLPTVEFVEGMYRAVPQSLRRGADQFAAILRQAQQPMHLREICHLAQRNVRGKILTARRLSYQLQHDSRFIPISRSGFWALTEWDNVETRSIADIAAQLLARSEKPMHEKQLFRSISKERPLSTSLWRVIGWHLSLDTRFVKTSPSNWMLAKVSSRRQRAAQ